MVAQRGGGGYSFFGSVVTDGCPCSHTRVSESNELTVSQTNRRHEENLLKLKNGFSGNRQGMREKTTNIHHIYE